MILPVYVYGMPVLRKKAKEIEPDFEGLDQLIDDMFETMYHADGVGLAAPQIGQSLRLIVIDASEIEDESDPSLKDFKIVLINPRILKEEGEKWEFNEGCLSFPDIREGVFRQLTITLEYYDREFNRHEEEFDGIRARIIQHEVDHLEGILFVDKIAPLRKRLLQSKLKAISKGQCEINYKIVYPRKK
jgi:peptide deformylase